MTVDQDNIFFKRLLDLVPSQVYFNQDKKSQIRNNGKNEDKDGHPSKKKKTKKHKLDDPVNKEPITKLQATLNAIEDKIKAKKESKKKKKKEKQPNFQTNIQELQEKLKARIEELQAKRAGMLTEAEKQEEKSLRRKQKRLTVKAKKQKNAKAKSSDTSNKPVVVSTSSASQTQKGSIGISSEKEGKVMFSKFEFSKSSQEKDTHKSKLVGKDYKRLLQKLEQRDAKIAKVKEKDPAAATKLEQKYVWQDVLSKARGEKVKDDPSLLKKALKRKEKIQYVHKKKWGDRQKTVKLQQKARQEKRNKNIEARKDAKKEKKRKKLIKKGRVLPGL